MALIVFYISGSENLPKNFVTSLAKFPVVNQCLSLIAYEYGNVCLIISIKLIICGDYATQGHEYVRLLYYFLILYMHPKLAQFYLLGCKWMSRKGS